LPALYYDIASLPGEEEVPILVPNKACCLLQCEAAQRKTHFRIISPQEFRFEFSFSLLLSSRVNIFVSHGYAKCKPTGSFRIIGLSLQSKQ
jgi:hypothetical protein